MTGTARSRVQLALNVGDLDAAVAFYGRLFATEPSKRRPGYAAFTMTEPPLKLVLVENAGTRGDGVAGALNHLGVEVPTSDDVDAAARRLIGEGLDLLTQDATTCCYALQDKVWVHDPDGAPWEVYTVLADSDRSGDLVGSPLVGGPLADGSHAAAAGIEADAAAAPTCAVEATGCCA